MTTIPFFTDEIRIRVHTATHRSHVGREMTIQEFVGDQACCLQRTDSGDLLATRGTVGRRGFTSNAFIEGTEA